MAEFYFDEIINVIKIDSQAIYDKVSRIIAKSEEEDGYLELDVHSQLYPMLPGDKYRMVISDTLIISDSEGKQKSLADKFEYVMHGLLYKLSEAKESTGDVDDESYDVKVVVYISFGGLQFMLKGDPLKMHKFRVDQRLFLLLRKIYIPGEIFKQEACVSAIGRHCKTDYSNRCRNISAEGYKRNTVTAALLSVSQPTVILLSRHSTC